MDTIVEQLEKEEKALLAKLAGVRAALEAYKGRPAEPVVSAVLLPPGAPALDGLRIRDGINVYLNWCRDNGRDRITLAELEKVLLSSRVVSFRGQPIGEMKYPFKTLTNILGSPNNQETWIVEMHSQEHYQRADTIGLKAPKRKPAVG